MAIKSSDLQWWFPDTGGKLGTRAQSGVLHNMFPAMTGANNRDLVVDYIRPIIIFNASALTLSAAKVFFKLVTSGGANYAMALDPLGVQAGANKIVSNYEDRPTSFSAPTTFASGIALPASLTASTGIAVWVRRTGANSTAGYTNEKNTITIQGTTPA